MKLRVALWGLALVGLVATGCTENFSVTYVNMTQETVLATLNGDGPTRISAGEEVGASYLKSQTDPPYRIVVVSLEGDILLDVVLTEEELEATEHRIVVEH